MPPPPAANAAIGDWIAHNSPRLSQLRSDIGAVEVALQFPDQSVVLSSDCERLRADVAADHGLVPIPDARLQRELVGTLGLLSQAVANCASQSASVYINASGRVSDVLNGLGRDLFPS